MTRSWSLGIVEQSQGEELLLTVEKQRGGDCGGKCLRRKARKPRKQGETAESWIEGGASP